MATRVYESGVVQQTIDRVWEAVRPLDFKFLSSVSKCEVEGGVSAAKLGSIRRVRYQDGTVQRFRLVELSDAHNTITYEVLSSEPVLTYLSAVHTIALTRISTLNQTLVELISDFSKDAGSDVIQDSKYKKLEFLQGLSGAVEPKAVKLFRQVSGHASKFDKVTTTLVEAGWKAFDKDNTGVLDKAQMKDVIEGLLKRIAAEAASIRGVVIAMFDAARKPDEKQELKAGDVADTIFADLQKRKDALVREISSKLDINKDGKVDFSEFKLLFAKWFEEKLQEGIRNALK